MKGEDKVEEKGEEVTWPELQEILKQTLASGRNMCVVVSQVRRIRERSEQTNDKGYYSMNARDKNYAKKTDREEEEIQH